MFGVLQLAYYSLGSYSYLDTYLSPLSQLVITNGYHIDNLVTEVYTNKILSFIGVHSSFLNNHNVMGLLMFAFVTLIGICLIVTKLTSKKKL
jgi:hypothetical protein